MRSKARELTMIGVVISLLVTREGDKRQVVETPDMST